MPISIKGDGSLVIGGVTIANVEECEVTVETQFDDIKEWGVNWRQGIPIDAQWSGTARRTMRTINVNTFLGYAAQTPGVTVPATLILYNTPQGGASTKVFEGACWIESATYSQPKGAVSENVSIRGEGEPTYVAGVTP